MAGRSWVAGAEGSPWSADNLPYAATDDGVVTRIGDWVLLLAAAARATGSPYVDVLARPTLDALLALGPSRWPQLRAQVTQWVSDDAHATVLEPHLRPLSAVRLLLPFTVGDYVDFYASEHHAANLARMLRPGSPPLLPNWKHLPVGYHGRSGTVLVSGTPVRRPRGQRAADGGPEASPVFGPTQKLDIEAEVGFVVGAGSQHGVPVPVEAFTDHVFGVCLVNDWSARDIQQWEAQPLGPFLGKSFATSVSSWVTPLDALAAARRPVASAATPLLPYLQEKQPWGLSLTLEVRLDGEVVSRPTYASMHWSAAQMLAHLTVNGASVRTGDLFASGTVSGPAREQWGSLIELFGNDRFLADGDEVVITATAPGVGGSPIALGEVQGRVLPAVS